MLNAAKTPLFIEKESISRTINEYLEIQATTKHGAVEETDEERQERYHRENKELQRENQELQEEQSNRQTIMQNIALFILGCSMA